MSESKNSLFIELNDLVFEQVVPELRSENKVASARFQAIDVFVAKQINQSSKYFLVQIHESSLDAQTTQTSGQQQRLDWQLGLVKLTMNENYLLFLASLIEYHFNDAQALINFFRNLAPAAAAASDSSDLPRARNRGQVEVIDEQTLQ